MRPLGILALLATLVALLGGVVANRPAHAQTTSTYYYFPSADTTDARMVLLAGSPLRTLTNALDFRIGVPAGRTSFEIGLFDGDTNLGPQSQFNPDYVLTDDYGMPVLDAYNQPVMVRGIHGSWDTGDVPVIYRLYADPTGDGTGTQLIGEWGGNGFRTGGQPNQTSGAGWTAWTASPLPADHPAGSMPNNDWWNLTVVPSSAALSPSGNYFYRLSIKLLDPAADCLSSFKVRTNATMSLRPVLFTTVGGLTGGDEFFTVYPDSAKYWDATAQDFIIPANDPNYSSYVDWVKRRPTTYSGNWKFFLDVPSDQREFTLWDGDLDYGTSGRFPNTIITGDPITQVADTDDPDTAVGARPLGYENGSNDRDEAAQGTGNPEEDSFNDNWRRSPAINYTVVDPDNHQFKNSNPSGNEEWEKFTITTDPNASSGQADYSPSYAADGVTRVPLTAYLASGTWRLEVNGMDCFNTCYWRFPNPALAVDPPGDPNPPLHPFVLNNRVFRDYNNNGIFDPATDLPIPNVQVDLISQPGGNIQTTWTNSAGWISVKDPITGVLSQGVPVEAGTYVMRVVDSNFTSVGPLAGLYNTTHDTRTTITPSGQYVTNDEQERTVPGAGPAPQYTNLGYNLPQYGFTWFGYNNKAPVGTLFGIGGIVWFDANADTKINASEIGFGGVTVQLYQTGGTAPIASTTTDSSGSYAFKNLQPGNYTVKVVRSTLPRTDMIETWDYDGTATLDIAKLTLPVGQNLFGIDFGYVYYDTRPFTTYTPGGWGSNPDGSNAASRLLVIGFSSVYPNGVVMGSIRTAKFTSAMAVIDYLPAGGTTGIFNADYVNPIDTSAGNLAGQLLSLQLAIDFSNAGYLRRGLPYLTVSKGPLTGYSLINVVRIGHKVVGGDLSALPPGVTLTELQSALSDLNRNMDNGGDKGYLR